MKMHTNTLGLFAGLSLMTAAACAPEGEGDDLEFRTTNGCNCGLGGSNSAHVNLYPVDQVNLPGEPNSDGVSLWGLRSPGGIKYGLGIAFDELYAWDTATQSVAAEAGDLVGWTIELYHAGDDALLKIYILGHESAVSPAYGEKQVSGYALAYDDPENPSELVSVCPQLSDDPEAIAATFIHGELYDATGNITVDNEWMTIACFGNAVAKMKLFGYGPSQYYPGTEQAATVDQRRATLRMLTADYCGTGESFTVDGTPIEWLNANGMIEPPGYSEGSTAYPAGPRPFADLEAIWTEDGALCIKEPRVYSVNDILNECQVPICTQAMFDDAVSGTLAHEWITWNPHT